MKITSPTGTHDSSTYGEQYDLPPGPQWTGGKSRVLEWMKLISKNEAKVDIVYKRWESVAGKERNGGTVGRRTARPH